MLLGDIIKRLIDVHGISQKRLAADLNLSPTTLGNYIRNIRQPDFKTLISFADYFNVSVDFLLSHTCANGNGTTPDEEMLLHLFRNMTDKNKLYLLDIGKVLSDKE